MPLLCLKMKPESAYVEANDIRLHYLSWGDEGSPPLVLLHPTGFLAWTWHPVAERLATAGYRVLAYDARGHGDSDKPPDDYHWQRMVDDLKNFLDRLSLRGLPLVGHSMGGGVAAYLAARHPGYASHLVLIEPIIFPAGERPNPGGSELAEGARRRRMVFDSVNNVVENYASRDTFSGWQPEALRIYAQHGTFQREDGTVQLKCPGEIEAQVFENSFSLNIWDAVPSINVPVLVMRGERTEGMLARVSEGVAGRAPRARLMTVAGAGHMAPMERPDAVAEAILDFIEDRDE